ncbi:unnamed protein product, partial [Mesorhabditis belari]|uniref:Uncharacterized protein n=1 Tax=Mesorhabditis belari TaxID=2138241 RepID=A0AAF3EY61_9BILA
MLFEIGLFLILNTLLSTVQCFIYRHRLVLPKDHWLRFSLHNWVLILAFHYFLFLFIGSICILRLPLEHPPNAQGLEKLLEDYPEYSFLGTDVNAWIAYMNQPIFPPILNFSSVLGLEILIPVVATELLLFSTSFVIHSIYLLESPLIHMSAKTKQLHKRLVYSLFVQIMIPFFSVAGPLVLQTMEESLQINVAQWPGCKIVHGKPRHSQSQGSVEQANADIEDILSVHQRETKTTEWARFLPLIQYRKNIRFHSGIGRSHMLQCLDETQKMLQRLLRKKFCQTTTKSSKKSAYEQEEKTLQEDNSTRYAGLRPVSFMDSIESGVEKFPEFANQRNNEAFQLGIVRPMLGAQKDEEQAEINCTKDASRQLTKFCTN